MLVVLCISTTIPEKVIWNQKWQLSCYGAHTRVGHAYAEYANDADYAHMRNMRMRMRIENLIHIIHIWIFAKNGNFLGQKWVSLALFSILSAQNIIIVHTSWFYPSSGMKIKSPKSQNFGQEKMIFFYYWCGLCALMRIWCASMHISKNRRMASPSIDPTLKI